MCGGIQCELSSTSKASVIEPGIVHMLVQSKPFCKPCEQLAQCKLIGFHFHSAQNVNIVPSVVVIVFVSVLDVFAAVVVAFVVGRFGGGRDSGHELL